MEERDRLDRWIPWLMVAMVLAVATFAFVQSYTHVFYLGQTHHQTGASLRMLPLSVDWLMFAAGLAMLHLGRKGIRHPLPRAALALGATATLVANVAAGIIWGWEAALISAWAPVVLFVVVELGMLLVRTAKAKPKADGPTGTVPIPVYPDTGTVMPEAIHAKVEPEAIHIEPEAVTAAQADPAQGWGQLAGQEPAGQPEQLGRNSGAVTGIGLANGRR